ncbi:MAG: molybdenum cofactor guanylyltransferase [Ignisphaera sp.]|nr:molybdenum cofactor guanylyltransferase [Ignisphaera sp.]MCX8168392.1 molybdenum cofactor guanylyltransferase [Ignisphaera sp.]MDW8085776.1 molybdenum cofactor guanylyltransferase [Ignisphaera sp.]
MIVVAILAGGMSSRFLAGDKLLYPVRGKPLIRYVVDSLMMCRYVSKVIAISSQSNINSINEHVETVQDPFQIGPLGALYLALRMFSEVFVVGGDMPFINCACLYTILEKCGFDGTISACMPQCNDYLEPLLSLYRRSMIGIIEYGIANRILSLQKLIKIFRVSIKTINICNSSELKTCLTNVNSVEDVHYRLHQILL